MVNEKLHIGFNVAYGMYNYDTIATRTWGRAALYLNYSFSDSFALGTRIKLFDDLAGVQYFGVNYNGYTVTGIFKLADGHFLIKPEL